MKKYIGSQAGISLIELIASIPLALLVILILSIVLINFITTYQEVQLYAHLQQDLFNSLEMMRYGYLHERFTGSPDDAADFKRPIVGLMTANAADIGIHPHSIFLSQEGDYHATYYAANGKLFVDIRHPNMSVSNIQLFPSKDEEIGNDKRFELIDYNVFSVREGTLEKPELLNVRLIGRVRFRGKDDSQTEAEDARLNTKAIQYEATVFLGNLK